MAQLRGEFVSEPIEVEVDLRAAGALARGEPSAPRAFRWRGEWHAVEQVLERWRRLAEDQGESYVRAHCFRVTTSEGLIAVLTCDRQIRRGRNPWRIVTVERK